MKEMSLLPQILVKSGGQIKKGSVIKAKEDFVLVEMAPRGSGKIFHIARRDIYDTRGWEG